MILFQRPNTLQRVKSKVVAVGNLNYGITDYGIFQFYHSSNFPLQKYARNKSNVCRALEGTILI